MSISSAAFRQAKPKTFYFPFLDGIRGITSLYVVFHHLIAGGVADLSAEPTSLFFLRFGHEAVVIFIVLSGFVLTLPLVHLEEKKFSDGLRGFFKRRAKRILPAYYMALLAYPLFLLVVELAKRFTGEATDVARLKQLFFSPNMLSHLLLLQNLKPEWHKASEYNMVLWSMATEWWIYFVFAIFLVPIWRKFGKYAALGFSFFLGLVPLTMYLSGLQTLVGYPHLVASFGMGVFTADLLGSLNDPSKPSVWRKRLLWAAGIATALFFLIVGFAPSIHQDYYLSYTTDLLLSIACAAIILILALNRLHAADAGRWSSFAMQILESPPAVFLGKISYSLYLTHLINFAMLGIILNLAPVKRVVSLTVEPMWVRLIIVIPLLILAAYIFYLFFEKPFLTRKSQARIAVPVEK